MKKNTFLTAVFIFASNLIIHAQVNTTIINQKTFGGSNIDFSATGVICQNGDYVVAGSSLSTISGDKIDTTRGLQDFWILRYNSSMTALWQKTFGGTNGDILYSIIETSDGGFLCGGSSDSPISGDKTISNVGLTDFWLIKLDANGNIIWQKTYGGSDVDVLKSIVELNDGSFILAGGSNSPISGDKTENSRGNGDFWIIKINNNGDKIWDKTIGGTDAEDLTFISNVNNTELILSGTSLSNISFEKSENSYGTYDNWVVKIDTSGNLIWDKTIGGSFQDYLGNAVFTSNGIYVISQSFSDISGTKTQNSKGQSDYWVTKLDINGNIIWDKTIGSDWYDIPRSITVTNDGQLLLSGHSWSGVSGDKTEATNGIYDFWLVSIDTSGNILWQKTIGGSDWDQLSVTLEISDNHYLLIGDSKSNISGDKTENSRGQEDYWIVEITSTVGIEEMNSNFISVYPNPANENITINFYPNKNSTKEIFIFDITEKIIYTSTASATSEKVDVSFLQNGVYILKVIDGNEESTFKLIKH